jgi:hypothetical protein
MKAYENDTSLRDAVNTLLQAEVLYLEKFWETITYRDYEELTEDQETTYTALENELTALEQATVAAGENLINIQKAFSEQYGYTLKE